MVFIQISYSTNKILQQLKTLQKNIELWSHVISCLLSLFSPRHYFLSSILVSLFSYPGVIFISWLWGFRFLIFCFPWRSLVAPGSAVLHSLCHLCPCRIRLFLSFILFCTLVSWSCPPTALFTLFTSLWRQFLLLIFGFSLWASVSTYHRAFHHFLSPFENLKQNGWHLSPLAVCL